MFLYNTNCEGIIKVTDNMSCKSSCGVDELVAKLFKIVYIF